MSEAKLVTNSPYDLIIATMLEKLEQHPEFESAILTRIRELVKSGELKRTDKVLAIIRSQAEQHHETA